MAKLTEEIRFRAEPATKRVIKDIAEEEGASMGEVARNLVRLALDSFAGDRRIEIKQLGEAIESTEERLDALKDAWKEVTGEEWEDEE